MRYAYPYTLSAEIGGGFTVAFPDIPAANTQGETEAECAAMAEDALVAALSFYTEDGLPLPRASAPRGRPVAIVPTLAAAKFALHEAKLGLALNNVELAKRLGLRESEVRRLLNPAHNSRIAALDAALRTLGRRLVVDVRDAA